MRRIDLPRQRQPTAEVSSPLNPNCMLRVKGSGSQICLRRLGISGGGAVTALPPPTLRLGPLKGRRNCLADVLRGRDSWERGEGLGRGSWVPKDFHGEGDWDFMGVGRCEGQMGCEVEGAGLCR